MALACGLPAGASSRTGADWKRLNYFIYEIQSMLVTTDGSWDNADPVRVIQPGSLF